MEPGAEKALGSLEVKVSSQGKKFFFTAFVILAVIVFYLIFNVGNPNSILRYVIKSSSYDTIILVVLAAFLSLMSFYYVHASETGGYEKIVQANLKKIQKLRKRGKTNEEIAESILNAMNVKKGYRYRYAMRRVIIILERVK